MSENKSRLFDIAKRSTNFDDFLNKLHQPTQQTTEGYTKSATVNAIQIAREILEAHGSFSDFHAKMEEIRRR
jgi:hypothetical protein